jgi:hypothetical protein
MRQGWAIGDVDGQVMHLDSQGKTTWKFGCYAPISLLASSLNGGLWIVDRSRALHQVDSDGKRIGSEILLPGDAIELFPDGRVLLEEGTTWKRNQLREAPLHPPPPGKQDAAIITAPLVVGQYSKITGSNNTGVPPPSPALLLKHPVAVEPPGLPVAMASSGCSNRMARSTVKSNSDHLLSTYTAVPEAGSWSHSQMVACATWKR